MLINKKNNKKSKREIKGNNIACRDFNNLLGKSNNSNPTTPHAKEEITRLAKAWCELVLDQIETTNQLKTNSKLTGAFNKITGENSN